MAIIVTIKPSGGMKVTPSGPTTTDIDHALRLISGGLHSGGEVQAIFLSLGEHCKIKIFSYFVILKFYNVYVTNTMTLYRQF